MTERELQVLAFAAVLGAVVAEQVGALLREPDDEAGGRLDALAAAGLVKRERSGSAWPDRFRITEAGLGVLGSDLPPPGFSARRLSELAVGWLWLMAVRERFGAVERVFTEREMRGYDGVWRLSTLGVRQPRGAAAALG